MTNLTAYPTREEWLLARRKTLQGSDAPAILGLSRWRTPRMVWQEKMGLAVPEEESEWLYWGHALEEVILKRLWLDVALLGYLTTTEQSIATRGVFGYSPDGLLLYNSAPMAILEAKNVSAYKIREWEHGIPEMYEVQVQHGMYVMDIGVAFVGALIGGNTFRWAKVERRADYEEEIEELGEWWERHVVGQECPPPTVGDDLDNIPSDGSTIALSPTAQYDTDKYVENAATVKRLKSEQDEIRMRMRLELGAAEVGILPTGQKWTCRADKNGKRRLTYSGEKEE